MDKELRIVIFINGERVTVARALEIIQGLEPPATASPVMPPASSKKQKRFTPPTLAQVTDRVREMGYSVDPVAFIAHYESVGWRVGRNPMKSWTASLTSWEHNEMGKQRKEAAKIEQNNAHPNRPMTVEQMRYDLVKIHKRKDARDWSDRKVVAAYKSLLGLPPVEVKSP